MMPPPPGTPTARASGSLSVSRALSATSGGMSCGDVDLEAVRRLHLLGGGRLADADASRRCRPAGRAGCRAGGAGRAASVTSSSMASAWSRPVTVGEDLGEHPVAGGRVVHERLARLEREPPAGERLPAALAGVPPVRAERRAREPAGVGEHLLDGHDVLAVGGELGQVGGRRRVHVDVALVDQPPDRPGHQRLGGGEAEEPAVVGRRRRWRRPPARRRARRRSDGRRRQALVRPRGGPGRAGARPWPDRGRSGRRRDRYARSRRDGTLPAARRHGRSTRSAPSARSAGFDVGAGLGALDDARCGRPGPGRTPGPWRSRSASERNDSRTATPSSRSPGDSTSWYVLRRFGGQQGRGPGARRSSRPGAWR